MNIKASIRWRTYLHLTAALVMVITGVAVMSQTFAYYNELSLARQDDQLEEMARNVDESIAMLMTDLREDLRYVLGRRGFQQAEREWLEEGSAEDLLVRMSENLVTQSPLIHGMLAVRGGEIALSTTGSSAYHFPVGMEDSLSPCYSPDGKMYLAVMEKSSETSYMAMLSVERMFEELARINVGGNVRLMLLGRQEKILLHDWLGISGVNSVKELNQENCDLTAVRYMMQSGADGTLLTTSYPLTYPGDDFVHEMRMTVIPVEKGRNGYFIVGLTSDYDEIIRPMNAALIRLIASGAMLVAGVILLSALALRLARQNRSRDTELRLLRQRSEETQKLLEKTRELAHHQRLETIGTLTASIAHEFNNLLTPIMGYSILTLEGLPEEYGDLADNVAEIYEASRKAKIIIARLSELSRRNAEERFQTLSLNMLADKALNVAAPAQPAHVTTMVEAEDTCFVSGSDVQLSQLLLNLILNAYHAMENTGGQLTLRMDVRGEDTVLQVEDTGSGIAPEALPHIFEPFYTTKESGRGTGLGLAIVQRVAESHHGEISVRSETGKGTVFTLRLPRVNPPEDGET